MAQTLVVIGSQWGDEGKGKITNYLSTKADLVVRYQGGDNAGHTIVFDGKTYKLHLIPSGIFDPQVINICANGMVINPFALVKEIKALQEQGFACGNLIISDRANVLFDYHQVLDGLYEEGLAEEKIGTTKKGIGPAYTDKVARQGIRMADFISSDFPNLYRKYASRKNEAIKRLGATPIDITKSLAEYEVLRNFLKPYIKDTISILHDAYNSNRKILFEGAQGALLDIDFGSYPYVTSSSPSSGGVVIGTGIGLTNIEAVLGIAKAYTTRVGEGPFPTELTDALGDAIRVKGNEYGTTTKRPRRIGWLDGVILSYSNMVNGMTGISLMLLDVLSGIKELKICTHYLLDGEVITSIPARSEDFARCKAEYISLEGWDEDITNVKSFDELPTNAQNYIRTIEKICKVKVQYFSVGPDRDQTIVCEEVF